MQLNHLNPYYSLRYRLYKVFSNLWLGDQLKVSWHRDRQGYSRYRIRDPLTDRIYWFDSAKAVRIWLETRSR